MQLAEGGAPLSAGQKQLVALSRALLRNSKVGLHSSERSQLQDRVAVLQRWAEPTGGAVQGSAEMVDMGAQISASLVSCQRLSCGVLRLEHSVTWLQPSFRLWLGVDALESIFKCFAA